MGILFLVKRFVLISLTEAGLVLFMTYKVDGVKFDDHIVWYLVCSPLRTGCIYYCPEELYHVLIYSVSSVSGINFCN